MTRNLEQHPYGSLNWLLSLDRESFIHSAFEVVLGRAPDQTGVAHYLDLLDKKQNKLQIISDLYASKEASARVQREDISAAVFQYRNPIRSRLLRAIQGGQPAYMKAGAVPGPRHSGSPSQAVSNEQFSDLLNAIHGKGNSIQDQLLQLEYRLDNVIHPAGDEILGDGETRYLFNLSTSNHWRAHPVGIIRVEREVASYLRRFSNVEYVLWDAQAQRLRQLAKVHTDRILTPEWCNGSAGLPSYNPANLAEATVRAGDIYISVGLDWDHSPTSQVMKYLRPLGGKAILACHDTVPTQFPELLVRDEIATEFRQHLVEMAHGTTKVWAVSESTRRDLLKFWESARLERELPEVFTVPLASYAGQDKLPILNDHDRAVMRDVFGKGEYVLYVSSVEPRKNHKLMLDIWRELWAERGEDCPQFVFVGMRGWGTSDMLERVSRMSAYIGGKINDLHHVSDDLLAHLYHNCSFAVFPSLYEGWGLAATESMEFGKVCVVANNSSLPQATQQLMPSYHPLDFPGWKAEIERLLDDVPYRQALERRIATEYQSLTWLDTGKKFCENIVLEKQKK